MTRRVVWVVLCEDEQHYTFANRFLKLLARPGSRQPPYKVLGPGHSGVRASLGKEVLAIRAQGGRSGLIVILDADGHSVDARRRYVQQSCNDDERPKDTDPIAILVPERNIETWIRWLEGQTVDATTRYRRLERERDCKAAVDRLKAHCDSQVLPDGAPPSLQDACTQFKRVLSILTE